VELARVRQSVISGRPILHVSAGELAAG